MNTPWNNLSPERKVSLMRIYIKNGIKYPEQMATHYNQYANGGKTNPISEWDKVDFDAWLGESNNHGRGADVAALEQLQDSLIGRKMGFAQRMAILATAAQEMDSKNGAASRGVGGNGYLGLSAERMPVSYLGNTPQQRAKQIHYLMEDLNHVYTGTHPLAGNWNDGGSGGPKVLSGQDGYNQFWSTNNVEQATKLLNKSYIRPAGKEASWNNRASVANEMKKHTYADGGKASLLQSIKPKNLPYPNQVGPSLQKFGESLIKESLSYSGGKSGGGGAGMPFLTIPQDTIVKDTLWVPFQETFNDAFASARRKGLTAFEFDGKLYNTELGDNPNNYRAGQNRVIEGIIPLEYEKKIKKSTK